MKQSIILAAALFLLATPVASADCSDGQCSETLFSDSFGAPPASTPGVELPPEGIGPIGPFTLPVGPEAAVLSTYHSGELYCVAADVATLDPIELGCVNPGTLRPTVPVMSVPLVPTDTVGTPGIVEEGELGSIPALSTSDTKVDVAITAHWNQDRLAPVVRVLGFDVPGPFSVLEPEDAQWWASSGPSETGIEVSYSISAPDGETVESGSVFVPVAGQLLGTVLDA